jgi:hypothetical protein
MNEEMQDESKIAANNVFNRREEKLAYIHRPAQK